MDKVRAEEDIEELQTIINNKIYEYEENKEKMEVKFKTEHI